MLSLTSSVARTSRRLWLVNDD